MADLPQHEDFVPQLNTKFSVKLEEENVVDLVLTDVGELVASPRQEQFSIVFRGPLEVFLGQGMRELKHDEMGDFALFLVPIKQDDNGFYYESVFNRLKK